MKYLAVVLLISVLSVGVQTLPTEEIANGIRSGQGRVISDIIASVIEEVTRAIIDAGLDPLVVERADLDYALPVPSIFNARGYVNGFLFQGASNIIINQLSFNVLTLRVIYDISLPQIILNVVDSELDVNFFETNFNGRYSGRLVLQDIVTTGNVQARVGIISGISINSIDLAIGIGNIDSQLNLSFQNSDYSNALNSFLGNTVPTTFKNFEADINSLLTIVGKSVIESFL